MTLQPRVFDLLVYLLRHSHRVVPKEELLSTLWPTVMVTEASLQRLVSLARSALRQGGMEQALRNFPRVGYRFNAPVELRQIDAVSPSPPTATAGQDRPQSLMQQQRWQEAVDAFAQADQDGGLSPGGLQDWALALECLGKPEQATAILHRALMAHDRDGATEAAASAAITLSKIHLERNELAMAKGWLSRAARLLERQDRGRAYALYCWMKARLLAAEGEPSQALALCQETYAIGEAIGAPDIESLGLIYRGFYKLCLGDIRAGLEDQDHAAALALSSDLDPVTGSTIYCNILWACRNFGDWGRAGEWTAGYEKWCSECGIHNFTGACQLHRAELLTVQGDLATAEEILTTALQTLASEAPWSLGDANRVLGDVYRKLGDRDKAQQAYQRASALGWDPQPGLALLHYEAGQGDAAMFGLERAMQGNDWLTLQRKGQLLAYLALVAAGLGDTNRSRAVVAELERDPARCSTPAVRAVMQEALANCHIREERLDLAAQHLDLSRRLWNEAGSDYHVTELRLRTAQVLQRLGKADAAASELDAAGLISRRLNVPRLIHWCEDLRRSQRQGA